MSSRLLGRGLSPITDQIFLTGVVGAKDVTALHDNSITHVLNVARELDSLTYPPHVVVEFMSIRDTEEENLLLYLDEAVEYVHQVLSAGGRIVVHCVAGVSRSACVCIAFLMKHRNMSLKDAHDKVKGAREIIYPNRGFWTSLIEYEFQLRGENSVELMPFLPGKVPSIESYKKEMATRIKLGWMDHLFFNIFCMLCLLIVQLVSVLALRSD